MTGKPTSAYDIAAFFGDFAEVAAQENISALVLWLLASDCGAVVVAAAFVDCAVLQCTGTLSLLEQMVGTWL